MFLLSQYERLFLVQGYKFEDGVLDKVHILLYLVNGTTSPVPVYQAQPSTPFIIMDVFFSFFSLLSSASHQNEGNPVEEDSSSGSMNSTICVIA